MLSALQEYTAVNQSKGGKKMKITIQTRAAFEVIGFSERFSCVGERENFEAIANMWTNLTQEKMEKLLLLADGKTNGFIGISDENGQTHFNYLIGTTSSLNKPKDLQSVKFPECEWLTATCIGAIPAAMIKLKKELVYNWLQNSDYEQTIHPRFEIYFQGDMTSDSYQSELWIPVRRRRNE
jgi:AraC family transcriptional regulator